MLQSPDIESLERATLDAVAPTAVEQLGNWLLPFDQSTIGRAKSAVPLRHTHLDSADLPLIVERYAARQLHAAFRVAAVPGLDNIHKRLYAQGFTPQQPTQVQVGTVQAILDAFGIPTDRPPSSTVLVTDRPTPEWSAVYTAHGFDPVDGGHRVMALSRSTHVIFSSLSDAQGPIAAGTASLSQGWCGIHGMRTLLRARGQGYAGQLLAALAIQAQARGIKRVFLQVDENSTSALALYLRAGFQTAWRYHYWRDSWDV